MIAAYSAGSALVWIVWVVAGFACLASGVAVVSFSNPFYSAIALIGNLASLAVLYLLLSAEFLAAAQVLVYAGAVMVMFLFVIAYIGRDADAPFAGGPNWMAIAAVVAAGVILVDVVIAIGRPEFDRLGAALDALEAEVRGERHRVADRRGQPLVHGGGSTGTAGRRRRRR